MTSTTGKVTIEAFADYAARHGRCELVNGEIRDMTPAGMRHGQITARLTSRLDSFAERHQLGDVLTGKTGFILEPDPPTVRAPDVAFIAAGTPTREHPTGFGQTPPDLCIEVLSPNDRAGEVAAKTRDWLRFGVRQVWIVDPQTRTVTIHHPDGHAQTLNEDQTLTGEDILPGFELRIAELFK